MFPGSCEFDQLKKIEQLLGEIPNYIVKDGRNLKKYFKFDSQQGKLVTKTNQEYYKENPNDTPPRNRIPFGMTSLDDLDNVKRNTIKKKEHHNISNSSFNSSNVNNEMAAFIHFLKCVLQIDPKLRWNAKQCLRHPFITKENLDSFLSNTSEEINPYMNYSNYNYSGERTQIMNNAFNYYPYYSMMMNNSFYNYNMMNNQKRMNMSFSNINYSAYYQNNNNSFGGFNPNMFERFSYKK